MPITWLLQVWLRVRRWWRIDCSDFQLKEHVKSRQPPLGSCLLAELHSCRIYTTLGSMSWL